MTMPILPREIPTQDLGRYNYFITPMVGCAYKCFVYNAERLPEDVLDHRTQLMVGCFKCYLFSSLN